MKNLLLLLSLFLLVFRAEAQIFRLNADFSNFLTAQPDNVRDPLISYFNTVITDLEVDINKELPANEPDRLMEGMANSSVYAGKGMANDYITNFDVFTVGFGLGVGLDMEKNSELDSDLSGAGVQGGLQFGINLNKIAPNTIMGLDTKKMNLMVHFMKYDIDQTLDEDKGSKVNADFMSMGFHLNYRWKDARGSRLLGWDGVKFHTGYQYNKTTIGFVTKIDETVNETNSGSTFAGNISGSPEGEIDVSTHSIPLEISTGVNFLYVFSLYGGLGADFNMGQAKGDASLNANPSNINCTGGACAGGETVTVTPEADLDYTGKVDSFTQRAFAGIQLNLPYVRIFVQGNKGIGTDMASVATGLRLAF